MDELLDYLIEQRKERAAKVDAFDLACRQLQEAQERVNDFGDMSGVVREISQLDAFIERVSTSIGSVDDSETIEVASNGAVTSVGEE